MKQFVNRSLMIMLGLIVGLTALGRVAVAQEPAHWTYEGEEGPEHWGELSPDFELCSTGAEQSPINIPADATLNPADLEYNYLPTAVNIHNNGHAIQVNYDPGSTLELDNQTYDLLQFHFHAGSEHTRDGQQMPIEMHLVHRNADGGLAVVGVWVQSGSENAAFAPVFDNLPATESEPEAVPGEMVNADELLPAERSYYRYNGSLTTPPCTQDVKWIMLNNPVELSEAQIAAFTDIFDSNFRPVQPFNERSFLLTSSQVESEMSSEGSAEPETLPASGGVAFPAAGVLVGLGALGLVTGTGLYLYRRKTL